MLRGYSLNVKLEVDSDDVLPDSVVDAIRTESVRVLNRNINLQHIPQRFQSQISVSYFTAFDFDGVEIERET